MGTKLDRAQDKVLFCRAICLISLGVNNDNVISTAGV